MYHLPGYHKQAVRFSNRSRPVHLAPSWLPSRNLLHCPPSPCTHCTTCAAPYDKVETTQATSPPYTKYKRSQRSSLTEFELTISPFYSSHELRDSTKLFRQNCDQALARKATNMPTHKQHPVDCHATRLVGTGEARDTTDATHPMSHSTLTGLQNLQHAGVYYQLLPFSNLL